MLKIEIVDQFNGIRDRLDYAERNINSHILEDSFVSGKVPVDGIVISILKESRDIIADGYRELGLDPAEAVAAFEQAIENCDSRDYTYEERKALLSDLKKYTQVEVS